MSYRMLRFDVAAAHADAWSDALLEAGALSVELSDPRAGAEGEVPVFAEPGADAPLWPVSRVAALFAGGADADAGLAQAAAALGEGLPVAERLDVAEQDWVRVTQAQFAPIDIGDGLWIVPSWCEAPPAARTVLRLDPGLAFGTGSHPTTRLCLRWLQHGAVSTSSLRRQGSSAVASSMVAPGGAGASIADATVLDYGCGSGILAFAASLLGARDVVGTDIDPQAIAASRANAAANGVQARFALPDAVPGGAFDVVIANILANPLVVLAPLLAARTRPGGRIALSGILEAQAAEVVAAYTPWFNIAPWQTAEGWVLVAGERRLPDATSRR